MQRGYIQDIYKINGNEKETATFLPAIFRDPSTFYQSILLDTSNEPIKRLVIMLHVSQQATPGRFRS